MNRSTDILFSDSSKSLSIKVYFLRNILSNFNERLSIAIQILTFVDFGKMTVSGLIVAAAPFFVVVVVPAVSVLVVPAVSVLVVPAVSVLVVVVVVPAVFVDVVVVVPAVFVDVAVVDPLALAVEPFH